MFGFQTGVLYYHANWIGNLAIAITGVSYLSVFFPVLNNPIPAGLATIASVWLFTLVNLLGGSWVSRLCTIGLVLILIPVVGTALFGWTHFDSALYSQNWNVSAGSDGHAVITAVLICLWSFVGVESAAVLPVWSKTKTHGATGNHVRYWSCGPYLCAINSNDQRYVPCL